MRKKLNGIWYDTDKARQLSVSVYYHEKSGEWEHNEYLFRNSTGEYFLFCETRTVHSPNYATCAVDSGLLETLTPVSEKDAMCWARARHTDDEYSKMFGVAA